MQGSSVSYGEDSLGELTQGLNQRGHESVLLVTGQRSFEQSGLGDLLQPVLAGRKTQRISNFDTNPKRQDVEKLSLIHI